MKQHDLAFANFICTFGANKYLLDFADEIVLPAFTNDTLVRTYGDTSYYFYETEFLDLGEREDTREVAIVGRFVKDTKLKRQQIIRRGSLINDYQEMDSAPSAFFVLLLSDHRLLYFAETMHAPSLDSFSSTAKIFIRRLWRRKVGEIHKANDGALTYREIHQQYPMPLVSVIPMARKSSIASSLASFAKIESIRLRLIKPNDESDASDVLDALRKRTVALSPERLDVEIADASGGLDYTGSVAFVEEATESAITDVSVFGRDSENNKIKADNSKFALSVPVENPPHETAALAKRLLREFIAQVGRGLVERAPLTADIKRRVQALGNNV